MLDIPESFGRAPRNANAFATHIPVLTAIGRALPIRKILEFGSGTISTSLFLNPSVFPSVESVVSYENDNDWYQLVQSEVTDDRLDLHFVANDMYTIVDSLDLANFDLIFVDDSKSMEQRTQTIRQVALRKDEVRGLVAIHDFEQRAYRKAASPFAHIKRFRAFNPEVGVLWTRQDLESRVLHLANQAIKHNVNHIQPDDVSGWIKVLETQSK